MPENITVKETGIFILKRIWILLISIVAISLLIGMPKALQNKSSMKGHVVKINEYFEFTNHSLTKSSTKTDKKYENYSMIWFNDLTLKRFLGYTAKDYDMTKLNPEWDSLTEEGRLAWIRTVFSCNVIDKTPGYMIFFNLPFTDQNYEYARKSAPEIFEKYILYSAACIDNLYGNSDYKILSYNMSIQKDDKNIMIIKKYFFIGAFLGFLFGVFLLIMIYITVNKRKEAKA